MNVSRRYTVDVYLFFLYTFTDSECIESIHCEELELVVLSNSSSSPDLIYVVKKT